MKDPISRVLLTATIIIVVVAVIGVLEKYVFHIDSEEHHIQKEIVVKPRSTIKTQKKEKPKKELSTFEIMDEILKERGQPLTTNPGDIEWNDKQFNKPNDMVVAVINNPNTGVQGFINANLTKSNTSLFTKEYYKTRNFIIDKFSVNNHFNHEKFNLTYLTAKEIYIRLP